MNCNLGLRPVRWGPFRRPFRPLLEAPALPTVLPVPTGVSLREVASETEAEPVDDKKQYLNQLLKFWTQLDALNNLDFRVYLVPIYANT